jgi:hypothetical protein
VVGLTNNSIPFPENDRSSPYEPLPKIITNERPLRDVGDDALDALTAYNNPPTLFQRSAEMIRVGRDEHNEPVMQPAKDGIVRYHLTRAANFIDERVRKDGTIEKHVDPPRNVVEYVRSVPTLPFPRLVGITRAPFFRGDGTIVSKPGYDPDSCLVYAPTHRGFTVEVPDEPTDEDLHDAVTTLDEAVGEFPYAGTAAAANTLGLLLSPILRNVISGPVPMALLDKPAPGTGGSLLAEVVSLIATGRAAGMMSAPRDDEEWRKQITSALLSTNFIVTVDNVSGTLQSASLSRCLTSRFWEDRRLGHSEMIRVPQRAVWISSGNNIQVGGDLPRRCYTIRLDPRTDRPWKRSGFKHPELERWVEANRASLVGALLCLGRAWMVRGRPVPADAPTIGSFESWSKTIAGVLHVAGVEGFLTNADEVYEHAADEAQEWYGFLSAWRKFYGGSSKTTKEIVNDLYDPSDGDVLRESLPNQFDTIDLERRDKSLARRLGNAFKSQLGRYRGDEGLHLVQRGEYKHAKKWAVETRETNPAESVSLESLVSLERYARADTRTHARTHGNGRDPTHPTHPTHHTNKENESTSGSDTADAKTNAGTSSTSGSDTADAKTNAGTSGSEGEQGVTSEVLAVVGDPPEFVKRHLDNITNDTNEIPPRVASAVSLAAYGTMDRWREVLPQLERFLDETR